MFKTLDISRIITRSYHVVFVPRMKSFGADQASVRSITDLMHVCSTDMKLSVIGTGIIGGSIHMIVEAGSYADLDRAIRRMRVRSIPTMLQFSISIIGGASVAGASNFIDGQVAI
jgi:hypothetical protein